MLNLWRCGEEFIVGIVLLLLSQGRELSEEQLLLLGTQLVQQPLRVLHRGSKTLARSFGSLLANSHSWLRCEPLRGLPGLLGRLLLRNKLL